MNKVIIQTRLTLEDFINVNFAVFFNRGTAKFRLLIAAFLIFAPFIMYAIGGQEYVSWGQSLVGVGLVAFIILSVYLGARRNYTTNKRISEPVTYDFNDERLLITGESSTSAITWDKIYKITQTKNWLVIWQSAQMVNCIPKRDTNSADLAIIKSIVQQNKVKNNFK